MHTLDREAFDTVEDKLENNGALTLEDIGAVFGADFWQLLVYTLVDAQVAARAIANALVRMSGEEEEEGDED